MMVFSRLLRSASTFVLASGQPLGNVPQGFERPERGAHVGGIDAGDNAPGVEYQLDDFSGHDDPPPA